jgi:peptide/nickel transport system permease protein
VLERLPATLKLAGAALLVTVVLSILLGIMAAYRAGGILDRCIGIFAGAGQSIPNFVIGPLLIVLFAVEWRMLPAAGSTGWESLVLPTLTLAFYPVGRVTQMMRTTAVRVLRLEFIDTARSKGISEAAVIFRHVLRNSLISVVTLLGLELAGLIGGAVITENIFGWPGIGTLARQAFATRDFPVAQAIVVVVAAIVVVVNFATDVAYSIIDPRIRVS